jgi:large subunit ribosomal protein L10
MPNQKNKDVVKNLREKVVKAKSIILTDFKGLSSNATNDFRAKMLEQQAEVTVAKNTLLKKAMEEEKVDIKAISEHLKGNTAAIFSYQDALAAIKPLVEFSKKFELPKIKAAIIDGIFTTGKQVETISQLPTKEQLLAQIVGTMNRHLPVCYCLKGSQRKLVYAVKAIAEKKELILNLKRRCF